MNYEKNILITGACGYVGRLLIQALQDVKFKNYRIYMLDVTANPNLPETERLVYLQNDIRDPGLEALMEGKRIDTVVHLASIVNPIPGQNEEFAYSVDVDGTRNLLEACVSLGVKQFIVTSSGAAYGYHADSPEWIREEDPLRGNDEFAYSRHKRLVEEMLRDLSGFISGTPAG